MSLFVVLVAVTQLALPGMAVAYSYQGNCNNVSNTTWDALYDYRSNVDGAEMDQYTLPASSSWATCTYNGGGGFGHMAELLSLQGNGIVQLGIIKFISSGGSSWQFVYTFNDANGGQVSNAYTYFGENPIAGRTYWLHIATVYIGQYWYWEYCLKDFTNSHQACWDLIASWHVGNYPWFGGETADQNDTMGARPEASTFRTFAMRVRDASTGWQAWLPDSKITSNCYGTGTNQYIANCNVQDTSGFPGMFIWNGQ
jgi:hypothetical protein